MLMPNSATYVSTPSKPAVACNICGKPGGTGSRGKLRVLLRRWMELQVAPRWANPTWEDGHAHAACYLDEQRALSQRN